MEPKGQVHHNMSGMKTYMVIHLPLFRLHSPSILMGITPQEALPSPNSKPRPKPIKGGASRDSNRQPDCQEGGHSSPLVFHCFMSKKRGGNFFKASSRKKHFFSKKEKRKIWLDSLKLQSDLQVPLYGNRL